MVPVINSDQVRQEEKTNAGYFQITKRNVKHFFFKFLDIYGQTLILSCQLIVFGIITVLNLF